MKKSTVILLVTSSLAIAWTLVFYWLAGTSILEVRLGKPPKYAIAPPPADTAIFLTTSPFSTIDISGDNVMVILSYGSSFNITMKEHLKKDITLYLKDGKLMIRIKKIPIKESMDTIFIHVPALKSVFLYSYTMKDRHPLGIILNNLNLPEMRITTECISPVIISRCTISAMTMEINNHSKQQEINIAASNSFDSLYLYCPGAADLALGSAGLVKNDFRLSGSVKIHSTAGILQKISLSNKN